MDTNSPKFSELLPAYIKKLKAYDRAAEKLAEAKQAAESASIELSEVAEPLKAAMVSRGLQSIREHSWAGVYYYLTAAGSFERREISEPDELDEQAEPEPVEANHV